MLHRAFSEEIQGFESSSHHLYLSNFGRRNTLSTCLEMFDLIMGFGQLVEIEHCYIKVYIKEFPFLYSLKRYKFRFYRLLNFTYFRVNVTGDHAKFLEP